VHFEVRAVFIRTEPDGGENRFHTKWAPFDSEAGEFLIERAEPVDCEIQARADGFIEGKSRRFSIPAGGLADAVVIALDRGASVEGIVSDAESGEPVAGVLVRAHQHDTYFPWLLQEAKASYDAKGIWKLAMSDADGRFALHGLALEETIHLVAWKDGYGPVVRPGLAVGQGVGALRISMARAATLVIVASFRQRPGLRHAFFAHHREGKPWRAAFHASSETERPGPVEIPGLPPGAYRLAVCAVSREGEGTSRRLLGEVRLELAPGERRELPLDVDGLAGRFGSVAGRVTGANDHGGARLHIVSSADPEEPYAYGPTIPGPDGSFQFTGLPAGDYVIQAAGDASGPTAGVRLPVRLSEREHLDVDLALQ
jgi:hypothetical protein